MDRLFDTSPEVERICATCAHSTPRHGKHNRNTYPLVCLLKACAVPYRCGMGMGVHRFDYPCRIDQDDGGVFPRGWEKKRE